MHTHRCVLIEIPMEIEMIMFLIGIIGHWTDQRKLLYKRRTWEEHGQNMSCARSFHGNSMLNLLSYCGLIDAKIRAFDKDLPLISVTLYKLDII